MHNAYPIPPIRILLRHGSSFDAGRSILRATNRQPPSPKIHSLKNFYQPYQQTDFNYCVRVFHFDFDRIVRKKGKKGDV